MQRLSMLGLGAVFTLSAFSTVQAADLGGNCCADIEERIAELEATVAKKGNRKVTLTVSGQVVQELLWSDAAASASLKTGKVQDNALEGTRVRFVGEGKVTPSFRAGYVLELGVDQNASEQVSVRHSYVYIDTVAGKFSLGHTSQATNHIMEMSVVNLAIASKTLNSDPLGIHNGIDGDRKDLVRYDSPSMGGVVISASLTSGSDEKDVALRWAGEANDFKAALGVGYREADAINDKMIGGSASLMNLSTGLFANFAAAKNDNLSLSFVGFQPFKVAIGEVKSYQIQAGIERNFFGIGATTLYGEYGNFDLGKSVSLDLVGGGVVQRIDAAAMDAFVAVQQYSVGSGQDVTVTRVGARIQF